LESDENFSQSRRFYTGAAAFCDGPFSNLFRLPARSVGEEKRELLPETTTAKAAFLERGRRRARRGLND